jgi:hypothetical protein
VFVVLTIDVVECQDTIDPFHVVFEGLAKRIVHIHLSASG